MVDFTDWAKLAGEVDGILAGFQQVTMNRVVAGGYNPEDGTTTEPSESAVTGWGAPVGYGIKDIDGTLIQSSDNRLLLSAVGMRMPLPGDTATIDGAVYVVVNCSPLNPGGPSVLYDVQVRR